MIEALIRLLSAYVFLGLSIIPFALLAALIRGGLRGRRDRAVRRNEVHDFD